MRREENQLDATECFIALLICSTCFGHFYAHHQELDNILVLLPHMVFNVLVAGGRLLGAELQATRPGWGKLCDWVSIRGISDPYFNCDGFATTAQHARHNAVCRIIGLYLHYLHRFDTEPVIMGWRTGRVGPIAVRQTKRFTTRSCQPGVTNLLLGGTCYF